MKKILLNLIILSLLLCGSVYSLEVMSGEVVSVQNLDSINGNLYVFGSTINLNNTVDGDVVAFGKNMDFNANIINDLIAAGENIKITGDIGGDVRVACQEITINSIIDKEVLIAAKKIHIGKNAVINRDVKLNAEEVVIEGILNKNAEIESNIIKITKDGLIKGTLHYSADYEFNTKPNVEGDITYYKAERHKTANKIKDNLLSLVSLIFVGLVLLAIFPRYFSRSLQLIQENFWMSILVGFLILILVPVASLIFFITIIGIPLSIVLIALYVVAIYISKLIPAYYLGTAILRKNRFLNMILGVTILFLLCLVPYVGWFFKIIAVMIGIGIICGRLIALRR